MKMSIVKLRQLHLSALSKLESKRILIAISGLLAIDWVTIQANVHILRQSLGLVILLFLPGLLLTQFLDISFKNIWEYLVLSLGLSILYLMFAGLIFNQLFIWLGIPGPLNNANVIGMILLSCGLMAIYIVAIKKKPTPFFGQILIIDANALLLLIPTIFPALAAIGALVLNSGGSNLISSSVLVLMIFYVLILSRSYQSISWEVLAFSILMIGLAMLLSFSLRSLHISGWDINQEYYVFQLTKTHQKWSIDYFNDPYNSCLSISILPTIINAFLGINDEYIFKVIYQFIFAFVPLIMFFIARKYVMSFLAFLASLFFIFQPWFIQPAPALERQEIALLFFSLFIWATFHSGFSKQQASLLQILFGAAMITSHYSTAYIAIILFTLHFLVVKGLRKVLPVLHKPARKSSYISGNILLILYILTFFWTNIQTQTSGNVAYVFMGTLQNMKSSFLSDLRSEDVQMSIFKIDQSFTQEDLHQYAAAETDSYSSLPNLYTQKEIGEYTPSMVTSFEFAGTIHSTNIKTIFQYVLFSMKQITKLFLIVGSLWWFYIFLKSKRLHDEFALLNLISLALLLTFIILPLLSLFYNLFRIYLQILVVSSVSVIVGFYLLFSKLKINARIALITGLIVFFFISTNGLFNFIIGGPANLNLYNYGEDYDKFYTHSQEVSAAQWLAIIKNSTDRIYADDTASLRLISFGNGILNTEKSILPSTITKDSYVYLDYANINAGIAGATYNGKQLTYKFPIEFLDNNKNLIYDNGGSRIYR